VQTPHPDTWRLRRRWLARRPMGTPNLASFTRAAAGRFRQRLHDADRLSRLTDWYAALPICAAVEKAAGSPVILTMGCRCLPSARRQ